MAKNAQISSQVTMFCNGFLQKLASMQETGPVDIVVGWEPLVFCVWKSRSWAANPKWRGFSQGCIVSHLVAAVLRERGAEGGDLQMVWGDSCWETMLKHVMVSWHRYQSMLYHTHPETNSTWKIRSEGVPFPFVMRQPGFFCCAFREECVSRRGVGIWVPSAMTIL